MLDIFGNVFGRSKTSKTSSSSTANQQNQHENENADGFIVVDNNNDNTTMPDDPPPLYPTTMLTDEMFKTTAPSVSSANVGHGHIDANKPFSHQRQYSTPIDNVPFTSFGSDITINYTNNQYNSINETLDRVGQFLSTPSQSEYNFNLENSILRESLVP